MYGTYTDSPDTPETSDIKPILYTSIPSYVTSDHVTFPSFISRIMLILFLQKPVVALLAVPTQVFSKSSSPLDSTIPMLRLPDSFTLPTDPNWYAKRVLGSAVGYVVGYVWTLLWYIGLGNAPIGVINFLVGAAAWRWWSGSRGIALGDGDV